MKATERDHIRNVGDERFAAALASATMLVKQDRRLVGLDKIRVPLAFEAALVATGFPPRGFSIGKDIELSAEMHEICAELLAKASTSARSIA